MVAEMLSQEEINALLGSISTDDGSSGSGLDQDRNEKIGGTVTLNPDEIDALGEIGNISMGTAATTLFTLLNHKVLITTPKVEALTWDEFVETLTDDLTAVAVDYTEGFIGSNLMILKDHDVKIIADLMMGGTGMYLEGPITDLHLSAIAEAMNQMIGSSSTSMAQIFNKKIDISPPQALKMESNLENIFGPRGDLVKISFRLQIEENIIDSELMQILPLQFAKELIAGLLTQEEVESDKASIPEAQPMQQAYQNPSPQAAPIYAPTSASDQMFSKVSAEYHKSNSVKQESSIRPDVDIKLPQFQSFDSHTKVYPKENMDILMDVSLEVSVELGRTSRKIKEILEFGPGSIIELNRLVGEPVDVLVNGKFVATGEVVVIDENFGIRITDIINMENRI
ncbi:MAG: flagellar motor switch phosphatase FliY [Candidatus Cellulosilyticum pullistercoris]|uniref:Flagellar motor switch phosphatase FliY n=1 Tax=Candidatus Cellulosilyticum pullistercoris TaxID=2838521 RepID=A0A9E2KCN6_9FIRM|nr:flagellar motor switch phosphatase FliY [Candidatus Cellulosilyticum pullistercoris]